jgi:hypothetical protein
MPINIFAARYVAAALADVGYLEKKNGDPRYLNDKKANAGRANFTKYGAWYGNNGDFWCMQAQSFWAWAAGIPETIIPKSQSCGWSVGWFSDRGRYHKRGAGYDPQMGDQTIFCDKNGAPAHVGLIYATDDDTIYTVEGNTSAGGEPIPNGGAVELKIYPKTSTYIHGYCNPDYAALEADATMTTADLDKWYNTKNPMIATIDDVPGYIRPEIQALLDAGAINGGTPAAVNAKDINKRLDTLETAAIMFRAMKGGVPQ